MLDYFAVFTRGGIVLFAKQWVPSMRGDPVGRLVSEVLLEDRLGERVFVAGPHALRWALDNERGLVYVAVFQKLLGLAAFADDVLDAARAKFSAVHRPELPPAAVAPLFARKFAKLYDRLELRAIEARSPAVAQQQPTQQQQQQQTAAAQQQPRAFAETERGKEITREQQARPNASKKRKEKAKKEPTVAQQQQQQQQQTPTPPAEPNEEPPATSAEPSAEALQQLLAARGRRPGPMRRFERKKKEPKEPAKPAKERRVWEDEFALVDEAQFNRGPKAAGGAEEGAERVDVDQLEFKMEYDEDAVSSDESDSDDDDDDDAAAAEAAAKKPRKGVWSFFTGLTGGKELEREGLEPVVAKFREHLHAKNVAFDIADRLCESVVAGLVGKKLGTFQGVAKTARAALEETLTRILTPRRNIDILRDVAAHKKANTGRPFSIVFMGVNGVGKSTNLAKVGSWLRKSGFSVMFAACDTFRSGAVEQLRVHSGRLGIKLYERGYGKDDTAIATDALSQAQAEGIDVVLIDTAGRMQDKEPLMRAISKLVNTVQPNLVLFVGEALVGNDAVDQLQKFNESLRDGAAAVSAASAASPRLIDGIILTKFDTVDDKVGTAISMVYTTGVPIVFLGTGQHYTDLKKLQVATVVRTLLQ